MTWTRKGQLYGPPEWQRELRAKRADAWTKYACASAAAFTRAFLRTRPIPVASSAVAADPR